MIDLVGKTVDRCGWAGPLLWVCTTDGYSIHLYDAPVHFNGVPVKEGADIGATLTGIAVSSIGHGPDEFTVSFGTDQVLTVASSSVETARVFRKGDDSSHVVYKSGALVEDHG